MIGNKLVDRSVFGAALIGAALVSSAATAAEPLEGVWLTPQKSEMTINACVEGFCGYISKIVITEAIRQKYGPEVDAVAVFTDYNNKDPALKDRPIQGLQILTLVPTRGKPGEYEGEIYNPEDGETYAGFLTVTGPDTMTLKGCAYMMLCAEQKWTRVALPE